MGEFRSAFCSLLSAFLLALPLTVLAADAPSGPVFEIPKLDNITIDGKTDDWGDKGFRVDILADAYGKVPSPSNYSCKFRLGWNDKGLLVLVTVTDDVPLEPATKPEELWKGDSIEFFAANERGGNDCYQVVVAPGCDPNSPEPRTNISDYRQNKGPKLAIEVKREKMDKGFVMEALLPWKNLSIEAQDGREVGFQLYANDSDKADQRTQLLWYPVPEANVDSNRMYRIKLGAKVSPPVSTLAFGGYDADGKAQVTVTAVADLKGKKIRIKDAEGNKLGDGKLEEAAGCSTAAITLKQKKDKPLGTVGVFLDDEELTKLTIPEPAKKKD